MQCDSLINTSQAYIHISYYLKIPVDSFSTTSFIISKKKTLKAYNPVLAGCHMDTTAA